MSFAHCQNAQLGHTYGDKGHPFIMIIISEDPLHQYQTFSSGVFNLGLSRLGIIPLTVSIRGKQLVIPGRNKLA